MKKIVVLSLALAAFILPAVSQTPADRLADIYKRALAAYESGDWEATVEITLELEAKGLTYEATHKAGSATVKDSWYECLWMRGCSLYQLGAYDESIAAFVILEKRYPAEADPYSWHAYALREQGDRAGADRLLLTSVAAVRKGDRYLLYWDLAWFDYVDGSWPASVAHADKAVALEPRAAGPRFVAALSSFGASDDRAGMAWFLAGYDATVLEPDFNDGVVEGFDGDLVTFLENRASSRGAWTGLWFCRYATNSDVDRALVVKQADAELLRGCLSRSGKMLAGTLEAIHDLCEAKGDAAKVAVVEGVWTWRVDTIPKRMDMFVGWITIATKTSGEGKYEDAIQSLENLKSAATLLFGPDGREAGMCLYYLGESCAASKDYGRAVGYFAQAAPILKATASKDDELPCLALIGLGKAYNRQGSYAEAVNAFETAIAWSTASFGADSLETGTCLFLAGIAANNGGEWKRAMTHLDKAVPIFERAHGRDSVQAVEVVAEAGRSYAALEDWAGAIQRFERALAVRLKALGPDDPLVADVSHDLGRAYMGKGDPAKAAEHLARAAAVYRAAGSGYEKAAVSALNDLGLILGDLGRHDDAIARFEEALAIQRRAFGDKTADAANIVGNLATAHAAKGDSRAAIAAFRRSLDLLAAVFGADDERLAPVHILLGDECRKVAAFDDALASYRRALAISEKVRGPLHRDVAVACNDIAVVLSDKGDYDGALEYYGRTKAIFEKISGPEHPDIAPCYANIGTVLNAKGDYEGAVASMEKALAIFAKAFGRESPTAATTLCNLGMTRTDSGDYERGIAELEEALAIRKRVLGPEHADTAAALNNLATARIRQGDYRAGMDAFGQALAIFAKTVGDTHPSYAVTLNNMGYAYQDRGDLVRALDCFERSYDIMTAAFGPDHETVAICLNNLGGLYADRGDFDRAAEYYDRSLALTLARFGETHPATARCYNNLATLRFENGEYDRAIECFEKAAKTDIALLGPEHESVGVIYANIGSVLVRKGAWDAALSRLDAAAAIQEKKFGKQHPNLIPVLASLGRAWDGKGDRKKAVAAYERASSIAVAAFGQDHLSVAACYARLGASARRAGDAAGAEAWYAKALAIAQKASSWADIAKYSISLGDARIDAGKSADALAAAKAGVAAVESARKSMGSTRTSFVARNLGVYHEALRAAVKLGDPDAAFEAAESLRARGFLDRLSLKAALESEGIAPADRDRMLELSDRLEFAAARLARELAKPDAKRDRALVDRLGADKRSLETQIAAVETRLLAVPRYRELRDPRVATLAEAKALCPRDAAILEYVIQEADPTAEDPVTPHCWCIVLTREDVAFVELDARYDWPGAVKRFRDAVFADDDPKAVAKLSEELYRGLIAPVESRIASKKALVVVPDGPLAFLPFDALRASSGARWLCQDHDLSLAPSVSVLAAAAAKPVKAASKILAFGGAVYGAPPEAEAALGSSLDYYRRLIPDGWPDLPGALGEVQAIGANVFGSAASTVRSGAAASERDLKALSASGELAGYGVVHFAVHGFFDADNPEFSAIVLSEASGGAGESREDGYLSVEEAALLELDAGLLTLSACETGLGRDVKGDGVVGLTRAFMTSGARRALVTLWTVDDAATKDFMLAVYRRVVKEGKSAREAIAETKRDFASSRNRPTPYYWAAFTLYGL